MDDQQRARAQFDAWAKSAAKTVHGFNRVEDMWDAWQAATAALRAAPEVGDSYVVLQRVDVKRLLAGDENSPGYELSRRRIAACLDLHNQHGVAVVPNCLEVIPPPALGAHEVHPEAVDVGLDLGKAGERLVAADALEHASGVRQNCDGSATALEVIRIPAGDGLDPITVYADDLGEGRGRLTVCCYADSWSYTAGWGAMGGSLHRFIADLNPHYLADNLLWPNAAKARKDKRQYVERIAAAVIAAFAARPQGVK